MSIRTERLSRMVQREVAELLGGEFHEASQALVTVTNVRVTNDLGIAYVYLSVLGEEEGRRQIAFRRVEDLAPQVRHALAQRIRHQVRKIPELRFFLDETQQPAARMEELFDRIRAERGEETADGADTPDAEGWERDG
ncbi:MAG: 30S ribosome-binding factor RbfA [Bacteroidota bacterium]